MLSLGHVMGQKLDLFWTHFSLIYLISWCLSSSDVSGKLGRVPQSVVDDEESVLRNLHKMSSDLTNLKRPAFNAMKNYLRSRPLPSPASVKRSKEIDPMDIAYHPMYGKE